MKLKRLKTIALVLATFFNPLGFDALFAIVTKWTGSYLITDMLFYLASASFFGLYFYLVKAEKKGESVDKSGKTPTEQI
jgi:hypothetical protein